MAELFDRYKAFNQSPPYQDVDLFTSDQALKDAVAANGGAADANALAAFLREFHPEGVWIHRSSRSSMARVFGATWSNSIRPITC